MSVLLPDDLARDLGLLLECGWFIASLQKPKMKTGKAFLVNATKDPAWKLLLGYDADLMANAYDHARLYRNEEEFTDLDRHGVIKAIVQPTVIKGPWQTLPED